MTINSGLRVITNKIKTVASDIVTVRTGTVASNYAAMSATIVTLDNDPDQTQVQALALGGPLPSGTRVMMIAYPPRGLAIIGTLTSPPWTGYTPTWTQGATITNTIAEADYAQDGRTITAAVNLTATSAGTANNPIIINLPVPARVAGGTKGSFAFQDASTGNIYAGSALLISTTTMAFVGSAAATTLFGQTGSAFALAIGTGDGLSAIVTYQSAS